jgi:ATP-dependent Clp protease ATP-binding subunit ClpB
MTLSDSKIDLIKGLETHLKSKIRGQDHVIAKVCSVLERGELGLTPTGKPKGTFLFLGPTGVGKTELTLEFTRYLFQSDLMFRFDMSELLHIDAIKQFIGDETGSIGRLGKVLTKHSKGVLLFDEIEKANRLIWDLFLQILDAGRITLGNDETYDLSQFYIVCTTNIGSADILRPNSLPFTTIERAVMAKLYQSFRPELIGRFSEKIVFKRLSYEVQREIAELTLEKEIIRLSKLGYKLDVSKSVLEFLVRKGVHKLLGARPMRSTVERYLGDVIRHALKNGKSGSGEVFYNEQSETLEIK